MYKDQLKSIIGENCPGYDARYGSSMISMGGPLSSSCDNCANFIRGKCKKDLYDYMKNLVNTN